MSASLNMVQIIARLGRDVDLKYSQSGTAVANISVATDESYTDRNGTKVDRTEWHRVVAYGKTAENCANFLAKGSLVYVEGSLQTRKWQDQQGQDRYTTEIKAQRVQFLDRKGDAPRGGQGGPGGYEDDYAAGGGSAPRQAPRGQGGGQRTQGGQGGGGQAQQRQAPRQQPQDEDLGPAFPSEASNMDEVPF